MEALKFSLKQKKLELVKTPIPQVSSPHDVLIKVAYAGICGTDLHIMTGEFPCEENRPFSPGHEFSGTVVEVGSAVTNVKKGDSVAVDPNHGCGVCHACHIGNVHFCKRGGINDTIGIYHDGGWAQYCLVPDGQAHLVPNGIPLQTAALTEPVSCLAHGWDKISPVTIGQKILVIGAGIIGSLWVSVLHHNGHRDVTVSEPNATRRQLLQKLETGFECISPDELKQRQQNDSEYLFDLVVDCSGFAPAIEQGYQLLAYGGKLCIFGVAPPHAKISVSPYEMFRKETTIVGVIINPFTFPKSISLLQAMGDRYLEYEKLGIGTFGLKDYETAIKQLKAGTIAKAVFKL